MNFKEKIIELRKQDLSLLDIVRITGKSKSTVYYHIQHLPLSKARLARLRQEQAERIRQYPLLRKGKSVRRFKKFSKWTPDLVSLVSHLIFDGEIAAHYCAYNNRSTNLVDKVGQLMQSIYRYEPARYQNPITGVRRISYYNVALAIYIAEKAAELKDGVRNLPTEHKRAFLRAFFDDEGCMDYRPAENRRSIRGYQKNMNVLFIVYDLLKEFDIVATIRKPNEVVIVGKENLKRFRREINFSRGLKMNGKRTNSRWKKHIEKRELLDRAIASFKS